VLVVFVLVMMWWSFFPRSDQTSLTIGGFLPSFLTLVLLFLLGSAALPDEVPAEGLSLREYYDRNGPYFWSLFAAVLGWLILVDGVTNARSGAISAWLRQNLIEFAILAVFVSLIFVRRRWWHAVAFLILTTGPLGWVARSLG